MDPVLHQLGGHIRFCHFEVFGHELAKQSGQIDNTGAPVFEQERRGRAQRIRGQEHFSLVTHATWNR